MKGTLLGLLIVAAGCGAEPSVPAPGAATTEQETAQPASEESTAMAQTETSAEDAQAAFVTFVRTVLPQTPGLEDDKQFAAGLVAKPQLEPDMYRTTKAELSAQLQSTFGKQHVAQNLLHGSPAQLEGTGECWVIQYESLLDGGVGGCVAGSPPEVLAVWVLPEG